MSKSEAQIQREIMLALSEAGETVWRNNTAQGWQGDKIIKEGRNVILINARPVKCGLCVGGSDLVGIKTVVIKQEDIGKTMGIFKAVEVKTIRGGASTHQRIFLEHVESKGGIAVIARSVSDAMI